jgi:hypothetical protein
MLVNYVLQRTLTRVVKAQSPNHMYSDSLTDDSMVRKYRSRVPWTMNEEAHQA